MDGPTDRPRPPARPSVVYMWRYSGYRGNELLFPTRRLRPSLRPSVGPIEAALWERDLCTAAAADRPSVAPPKHPPSALGLPSCAGMRPATGDGATSARSHAGHTHDGGGPPRATRPRTEERGKKEWPFVRSFIGMMVKNERTDGWAAERHSGRCRRKSTGYLLRMLLPRDVSATRHK